MKNILTLSFLQYIIVITYIKRTDACTSYRNPLSHNFLNRDKERARKILVNYFLSEALSGTFFYIEYSEYIFVQANNITLSTI